MVIMSLQSMGPRKPGKHERYPCNLSNLTAPGESLRDVIRAIALELDRRRGEFDEYLSREATANVFASGNLVLLTPL